MAGTLENSIVVVTGSDSGIGQAIAEEFARNGADVRVSHHHDRDGAEENRGRVKSHARRAIVVQADSRENATIERPSRGKSLGSPRTSSPRMQTMSPARRPTSKAGS